MAWKPALAAALSLGLALTSCQGSPEVWHLKVEWSELGDSGSAWLGSLDLPGAEVIEVLPYNTEKEDHLLKGPLSFVTSGADSMSDGVLLALHPSAHPTLWFRSTHGDTHLDLGTLPEGESTTLHLRWRSYVDVARLTDQEWEAALGYAPAQVSRSDSLPEVFYRGRLKVDRLDRAHDFDHILGRAEGLYETDALFRGAEDARRGVSEQIYVVAPSVLATGERFDLKLTVVDIYGEVVSTFAGDIELEVEGDGIEVPPLVSLHPEDAGVLTLSLAGEATGPGLARLLARDPTGHFGEGALPIRVEDAPTERIYWGDLHAHSNLSDGDYWDVDPRDVYAYSRDVAHLDFQAMTDHDYRRPLPDWKWRIQREEAANFYDPGRFVTLMGYEWSAEDIRFSEVIGHKNVIFRGEDPPIYSAWDPRYNTPEKLWDALRADPGVGAAITIPHHPTRPVEMSEKTPTFGGPGTDWRFNDEELQPLLEVYSRWGSSESTGEENPRPVRASRQTGSARYALGLGYNLALMASSDSHDGTPGMSVLPARVTVNVYPVGLVAARAPALSREEIFDALAGRRCYGTSGGRRMLLELETLGGHQVGERGYTTEAPTFRLAAAGTTELREVTLWAQQGEVTRLVWRQGPDGWSTHADVIDTHARGTTSYYLRVTQEDNEQGWIGPVILTRLDEPPEVESAGEAPLQR